MISLKHIEIYSKYEAVSGNGSIACESHATLALYCLGNSTHFFTSKAKEPFPVISFPLTHTVDIPHISQLNQNYIHVGRVAEHVKLWGNCWKATFLIYKWICSSDS